jgi:hypothetical protein
MADYPMTYFQAKRLCDLIDYEPEFNEAGERLPYAPGEAAFVRDEINDWPGWMMPIMQEAMRVVDAGDPITPEQRAERRRRIEAWWPKPRQELLARQKPSFIAELSPTIGQPSACSRNS